MEGELISSLASPSSQFKTLCNIGFLLRKTEINKNYHISQSGKYLKDTKRFAALSLPNADVYENYGSAVKEMYNTTSKNYSRH